MSQLLDSKPEHLMELADNLGSDLKSASMGQATDLAYLKHPLAQGAHSRPDGWFWVLSVGGTNMTLTQARFHKDKLELAPVTKHKLPTPLTGAVLARLLDDLLPPETQLVGLNFAYPLSPLTNHFGRLDGRMTQSTKEVDLSDLIGQVVGEWLSQQMKRPSLKMAVANDTICLLLSALESYPAHKRTQLISLVLGTGCNIALFESDTLAINLESGNFGRFRPTPSAVFIDQNSHHSGTQLFEKEVSGAYLADHFNFYADKQGLKTQIEDGAQLLPLTRQPDSAEGKLACQLVERSAAFIAAALKGVWLSRDKQPLSGIVEGGVYWGFPNYQHHVGTWLRRLGVPDGQVCLTRQLDSSLVGAAHLTTV